MRRSYIKRQSFRQICIFTAFIIPAVSLPGCDSENDKAWRKWRIEADKVDYRCGMFNNYEYRINRAYLFFWPTYQGRSDWEVQGPPPLSCSAKLETVPMEAYWPGLTPAGTHTEENLDSPNRIYIDLNSVGELKKWDLILNLNYRFGEGEWKKNPTYKKNVHNLNLDYINGPSWPFPDINEDYYWVEDVNGSITTFIECYTYNPAKEPSCRQDQYIPEMHAILKITYKQSHLKNWKKISRDVNAFIKQNRENIKRM